MYIYTPMPKSVARTKKICTSLSPSMTPGCYANFTKPPQSGEASIMDS